MLFPESGETMRAAGLKAIDTVVESTAVLISSKHPSDPKLVNLIATRIRGVITAQKYVLCVYNVERKNLAVAETITPGRRAPTITGLEDKDWVSVSAMVARKELATIMDQLSEIGATDIFATKLENTRTS
jgi:ATP phosphoribosyltransferase